MENDTQKALDVFYELRKDLLQSDEKVKLRHLDQLILLLESSFFNKMVVLQQSLSTLKNKKNLKSEDFKLNEETGEIIVETHEEVSKKDSMLQPLSPKDFLARVQAVAGDREMRHVQVNRTKPNETLGFSIQCSMFVHSNGIFVETMVKGGLAERCGLVAPCQIVAIDGVPLDNPDTNREVAIQALQSKHSRIDLYIALDKPGALLSPPKDKGHARNRSEQMLTKELNTEWTQYEVIELTSIDGSFGFGIMGGLTCDVIVRTILAGGAASLDGRLCPNDHIMYIDEQPVRNLSSVQVAEILKAAGQTVILIVARPFDQTTINTNSSGGCNIQMVETSELDARLEMIVAQLYPNDHCEMTVSSVDQQAPKRVSTRYKDENEDYAEFLILNLVSKGSDPGMRVVNTYTEEHNHLGTLVGVFVKDVVPGGAAHMSGIRRFDRLLKINGVPIELSQSEEAIYRMMQSSPSTNIHIQRYVSGPIYNDLLTSDLFPSRGTSSEDKRTRSTEIDSSTDSSDNDREEPQYQNLLRVLSAEERQHLIKKWSKVTGNNFEIIVAEFSKFTEEGGLGISLEGMVDVDEGGLEVRPHHYVRSIVSGGSASQSNLLREKDELLEVNGVSLYGVNHLEVVKILKSLPMSVILVCARETNHNLPLYHYDQDDVSIEAYRVCQDLDDIIALETGGRSAYSNKSKSQDDIDEWPGRDELKESTGRSRSHDPVSGLAVWDSQVTCVDLEKGPNGLGFSILDYQDPVDPQQSVIVIRSLVPNGAAAQDERIFPGDRLMSVNDIDVSQATMAEAVSALKRTGPGIVSVGIVKALCLQPGSPKIVSAQNPNILRQIIETSSTSETKLNLEEFRMDPIPEALEHKLRVSKLSGVKLGVKLENEGGYSNNENGFRIFAIEAGSPVELSGRLEVGDFITRINDHSVRNIGDRDLSRVLKDVTSCAGEIRISFIPASDCEIFFESRAIQANFG